ncbi:MAG: hypothetical protein SGJ00_09060 [bacterium]|nr:hypothetical protein [bacterium]
MKTTPFHICPRRIIFIGSPLCLGFILLFSLGALAQTVPNSGDILFTHVDADADVFEFITLKRLNLRSLYFADHGICANSTFRKTEDTFGLSQFTLLGDVPAGTLIRVASDTSSVYVNEMDARDGIVTLRASSLNLSGSGDQIIAYTGVPYGNSSCTAIGVNSYVAGINWAMASGWNLGSTSSNNSKAPGTNSDYASNNGLESIWYTGGIIGEVSTFYSNVGNGLRNTGNWTGTNSGVGVFTPVKNIQFHESNYVSGQVAILNMDSQGVSLNMSALLFGSANSDTRYMVVANENSPSINPVERYTSYQVSNDIDSADFVAISVASLPSSGISHGSGKIVYFDYSLPSQFYLKGLSKQICYYIYVYAVNGNGYTANLSSTAANFNFILNSSTLIAY